MPNFFHITAIIMHREFLLRQRKLAECINPLLFFIMVASIFPLASTMDANAIRSFAPGMIWMSVILAIMLSMASLFYYDYQDGSLEQWLLIPYPLSLLVLAKIFSHWLFIVVPLIVAAAIIAIMYGLDYYSIFILILTLLLGTPTLMLMAALSAALTVCLTQSGFLLAIILLPMCIPLLIFATTAVNGVAHGEPITAQLALLSSLLILALTLAPWAIVGALRIGLEE